MAIESKASIQDRLKANAEAMKKIRTRKEKEAQATQFQEAEVAPRQPGPLSTR